MLKDNANLYIRTETDKYLRTTKRGMIPYLFLLGYSDSNQEKQDQNLLCYHYTIAQTE